MQQSISLYDSALPPSLSLALSLACPDKQTIRANIPSNGPRQAKQSERDTVSQNEKSKHRRIDTNI